MKRTLIVVLIVVVVAAAVGLAAVLYTRPFCRYGAPDAADGLGGGQPVVSADAAKKLTGAETAPKTTGLPADRAGGDLTTGGDDAPTPLASRHSRLASQMTPQQRRAVIKARWSRMRKEIKYRLPSTYKLHRLSRAADPDLRLTYDQMEQIDRLNVVMKPKIEEALKDIWARRRKVQQDLRAAVAGRNDEEIKVNRARYTKLFGEENRIRQDVLDKQFRAMLKDVLTAEQMEILAGDLSSPEQIRKLYGRRQATSESVQYQNTKQ